jgi:mannose-1-phosphate guanylyltransferase
VHCVLPADHVVGSAADFRRSLRAAASEARREHRLVTLGIRPTFPATGYGYIELGEALALHEELAAHAVARFVEKPPLERAREFLASGRFRWNAGIFVWETGAILAAFERHAPEIVGPLRRCASPGELERVYARLPARSIDVAILERAERRSVLPVDFPWSDVGSWPSLAEVLPLDAQGNCVAGGAELAGEDARGCVAYADGGLVALVGVEDLIVVRSGDVTLVCPKDRAQEIRRLVERLAAEGRERWL